MRDKVLRLSWIAMGRRVGDGFLDSIYPARCELCGTLGEPGMCDKCRGEMVPMGVIQAPPGLDQVAAVAVYEGTAARAVRHLKFDRRTALAAPMARQIATLAHGLGLDEVDWVVPVPLHWRRWCTRGFNQAELLAEGFGPTRQLHAGLLRHRYTSPQVRVTVDVRRVQLEGAFHSDPLVRGTSVLLVDDVVTTGSTISACADALRQAGATWVGCVAYAAAMVK